MKLQHLKTVDTYRRNYGRRYSILPVDELSQEHFAIDCTHSFLRPQQYDLQIGDVVRWFENERYVQAEIATVQYTEASVQVILTNAQLLPPDFFPF